MSHNILCRDEISFTSLVSQILLNDCEMWGCFLKSVGNNYDKFVSRMALGVHSKASNHAVKGELGRFPLHLIIYTRIFEYFLRLLTLQNNQILNSALEINIYLNNVGKHSWFTTVKHPLHFTKLNDYTPNLPHLDYRTFPHMVRMFKRNLFKEYQEYWSKSLNKDKFDSSVGNKLSLYSEVKNEVRFESYLDLIKNVKTRVAVTKMRISCHLLPIESGRYKKIPRVERLCPLSNRSEIGDEFHYLLKCTHSSLSHIRGISLESLHLINSILRICLGRHYFYISRLCVMKTSQISVPRIENILNYYTSEL